MYRVILLVLLILPKLSSAACPPPPDAGLSYCLTNPLGSITTIEALLTAILNVLLIIAVPIIVFFLIFAGFNYVTAQGNPEKITTATRSLTYALIGGILILGAVALTAILTGIVDSFR